MPIHKFRSVEEMKGEVRRAPGDPALYRAIAALWSFGRQTLQHRFPPGVHKRRSIEEMNAATEGWRRANVEHRRR